ncbi:neprilysin-4 [Nilaparvata lugens]|uniref:neprilysin-4 n=1 Tax=Nilaparvata lugens TaxID=108931 RepID=UPI00193DC2BF|nr:neprilysin-4 [Nilaparvata lugens]
MQTYIRWFLLFLPFLLSLIDKNEGKTIQEVECKSEACLEAAADLNAGLDRSVNPCDDFYQFTCGNWAKVHPLPPTEAHWNQFNVVNLKLEQQLKKILETPNKPSDLEPVKALRMLYKTCTNIERLELDGLRPLMEQFDEWGGWPMLTNNWNPQDVNWQELLVYLSLNMDYSPLISTSVNVDRKNSNVYVITIDQPTLSLSRSMLVNPELYPVQISAFKKWILDMAAILGQQQRIEREVLMQIPIEVERIVNFEINLAKLTSPSELRRNGERIYNNMTIGDLQEWTDSASETGESLIDWLSLLKMLLQDTNSEIDLSERVIVREMDYLFNLVRLMESTQQKTIVNYLFIKWIRVISTEMTIDMRRATFFFDQVFTGAQEEQIRWRDCIVTANQAMPMAVGYIYVQEYFNDEAKKSALDILRNIQTTYIHKLADVSWMDNRTKMAAQDKLQAMTPAIGYPDWYHNNTALQIYYKNLRFGPHHYHNIQAYKRFTKLKNLRELRNPVDRNKWYFSPATVNAFYSPTMNTITFPAGILQPPFFKKGRPQALNYGGIGVVIGHEMTHGFDDHGRQSDKFGNLAQWWSAETLKKYLKKTECFVNQYSNYSLPELDELLMKTVKVNGLLTLGENMADNGGLQQAYLAYKKSMQNEKTELKLPGFQNFTSDQLFFLGFALNWCEASSKESLLQEVLSDPHAPHRFRVLGSVANSHEFSTAFSCPLGSPMNPKQKCSFW